MVVGEAKCESSMSFGSRITEISGYECTGIVATDDGDHPFLAEWIVGQK